VVQSTEDNRLSWADVVVAVCRRVVIVWWVH